MIKSAILLKLHNMKICECLDYIQQIYGKDLIKIEIPAL